MEWQVIQLSDQGYAEFKSLNSAWATATACNVMNLIFLILQLYMLLQLDLSAAATVLAIIISAFLNVLYYMRA